MAPATTSPVKILSDLGYEIWEMESDADMLKALIEAINNLTGDNPSDNRIPILQEAIQAIRGPKFKVKRTRLNVEKVLNKTQPRLEGQKLQQDSREVQSNNDSLSQTLIPRLDNISSALSTIGTILASQLSLERIAYRRKRKRDLINEKRQREKDLEKEGDTVGKTIKKIISQPIKSFGERLLQFLKSIALGAAVLSLYKWLQDEENLNKIKTIADWLGDNGGKLIKSLIKLGRLGIASKLGNLLKKIGSVFLDRVFLKPIMTFTEFLGKAASDLLSPGGRKILNEATKRGLRNVIKAARKVDPKLLKGLTKKQIGQLTEKNIIAFLRAKGYSYGEIRGILGEAYGRGKATMMMNVIEGVKGGVVSPALPKVPGIDLKSTVIESDPPFTNSQGKTGKQILDETVIKGTTKGTSKGGLELPIETYKGPEKTSKFKKWMESILNFLKKKGVKDTTGEIASLRRLLFKGAFIGLDVVGMTWDACDAYRTWNEDKKISSGMYALAAITQALSMGGASKFAGPSLGFTTLGAAFENEEFNKGAQAGMELDPSSAFGMGGGDPFLNILMKKREERREIEKNLDIKGSKNKIGDQSFLIPNDPNNSGVNIAMMGGNGTQSTSSSGTASNSDVLTYSSVNSEDPTIPSVSAMLSVTA